MISRNSGGRRRSSTTSTSPSSPTQSNPSARKPKKSGPSSAQKHSRSYSSSQRSSSKAPRRDTHKVVPKSSHRVEKKPPTNIPPVPKDTLRVIPIGGNEEVGRNMTFFEYGNDIVLHDMGLQFPEDNMPGIDYIVPNTKYLEGKERNIRGVVFSHGHLDHIGAAPILLEKLNFPPVIAMPLTIAMIKHRLDDYKKGYADKLKAIQVKKITDRVQLGSFNIGFFQVEHSIMDSMGTILETPVGTALHPGDWTMERDADDRTHIHYHHLADVKRPSILMLESLGSLKYGRHATHQELYENLHSIISAASGRVIIATFGSQVERVKWVIEACKQLGKKVALGGYSMKTNVEIASKLGYVKPNKGTMIDIRKIDDYPEKDVVVVCTGAQGEENAVLNRIASHQHKQIKLRKSDTVIFSSSIIPGNERTIQRLKDNIYRQCDNVIHGDLMDVHISGHGTRRDIVDMLDQVKPDYYIPTFANHFFLKEAESLAVSHGFRKERIFVPDNGTILELSKKDGLSVRKEKAPAEYIFVDGLGISDSQHIVLRDRQVLAEDGMMVIITTVDSHTGKLIQNPDIISRGFVFMKDNRKLIEDVRHKVKSLVIQSDPKSWADTDQIRNDIRDKIGQFVFTKTEKRPMILPVVIVV